MAPVTVLSTDPAQHVTAQAVGGGVGKSGDLVHSWRRRRGAGRVGRCSAGPPSIGVPLRVEGMALRELSESAASAASRRCAAAAEGDWG